jgi:hypothetical protein
MLRGRRLLSYRESRATGVGFIVVRAAAMSFAGLRGLSDVAIAQRR